MKEILLIKTAKNSFQCATNHDAEEVSGYKIGQAIKVKAVKQSERSLQHHKLYFGGLLELAFDYWEPKGGLIAPSEIDTLKKFSKWLDAQSGNTGAMHNAAREFLKQLSQSRASKIETPEKSKAQLHTWIKEQCGYYDLVLTPSGIKKEVKSINFNAMSQEQFNAFYKQAFDVVWKFILSRTFENEQQAENCINQLLAMG